MSRLLKVLLITISLSACDAITGKEVARLQINHLSTEGNLVIKETTLDLKKNDEVAIWSDMDLEYEGNVQLRFKVEVARDGKTIGGFELDPTDKNITIGETRLAVMDKVTWSFTGKNSEYKIDEDGKYTFKGILVASDNPSLRVNRAELVFKK